MADKFEGEMTAYATVTINNREPLDRVVGPGGDEWRSMFYSLHTDADVIEHFIFNAVANGVDDITRLEGWADCDKDAVEIDITYGVPYARRMS